MTPEKMIEQAELMIRYAKSVQEGKPIELQCQSESMKVWTAVDKGGPTWNFGYAEYREKPVPKEAWFCILSECDFDNFTKERAERASSCNGGRVVHMREVTSRES